MDILYTSNENYVRHMAASMISLCENNRSANRLCFHILSCEIEAQSQQKLKAMCDKYGREIVFYELGDIREQMKGEVDTLGFDVSILARLFVARFLPTSVARVLYLDCDTIVVDDLSELWETDIGGCMLAAVPEPVITKSRRPLLEMAPHHDYYNSGVLLFNLVRWRELDAEKTVLTYFAEHTGKLIAGDQDAINACFKEQIRSVSPRYNYASYNIYYPYRLLKRLSGESPYVSREVYQHAKEHPAIIHYLGEERPWRKTNTHPYTKEYHKYLSMTDWKDAPDEEGWKLYFFCFRIFNFITKPFPGLRYRIIDSLIPSFMRHRAKQLKAAKAKKEQK